jgi:hypothetical protein
MYQRTVALQHYDIGAAGQSHHPMPGGSLSLAKYPAATARLS